MPAEPGGPKFAASGTASRSSYGLIDLVLGGAPGTPGARWGRVERAPSPTGSGSQLKFINSASSRSEHKQRRREPPDGFGCQHEDRYHVGRQTGNRNLLGDRHQCKRAKRCGCYQHVQARCREISRGWLSTPVVPLVRCARSQERSYRHSPYSCRSLHGTFLALLNLPPASDGRH